MKAMVLKRMALKAKDRKGFTLVEVIVVLVILAILMAIAVPSLTGYIDKARKDALIAEAASAKTAVQTIISDAYSHSYTYTYGANLKVVFTTAADATSTPTSTKWTIKADDTTGSLEAAARALTGGTYTKIENVVTGDGKTDASPNNQIVGLKVTTASGTVATYANGVWTVS
jgi:prepilin-type N-terminal cleavage/methylation domain-containing protein